MSNKESVLSQAVEQSSTETQRPGGPSTSSRQSGTGRRNQNRLVITNPTTYEGKN